VSYCVCPTEHLCDPCYGRELTAKRGQARVLGEAWARIAGFEIVTRIGGRWQCSCSSPRRASATHRRPPPASFVDVPASSPYARWIEELYRRRVVGGCATNPLRYCPTDPVTRDHMALFGKVSR
jgi:hypothetical protein